MERSHARAEKLRGLSAPRPVAVGALLLLLLLVCAGPAGARAQQPRQKPTPEPAPAAAARPSFTLRVDKSGPARLFKLVAKDAKVADIAAEFSRQLEVPVKLSPLMQRHKITVDFSDLDLESSLRFLAPHALVDYTAGGDDGWQPQPLAVYLFAMNEQLPPINETVKSSAESLLIEGDTEEGTEAYEKKKKEEPLEIAFANNRLSVRAEKQPLAVVLFRVASELGIPFELQREPSEVVDVNFQQYPVDQAMRSLSPSIRLFYRADLLNFEKYAIRIALGGPAPKAEDKN